MVTTEQAPLHIWEPFENGKDTRSFFQFEEDFVEDNIRCIPMIVRFKLDACGIKLKLQEWCKFSCAERNSLAELPCVRQDDVFAYRKHLQSLVYARTGKQATDLSVDLKPDWANTAQIPEQLINMLLVYDWRISLLQWQQLSNLRRFVLIKLCRPGHENKNFPFAVKEFALV